MAGRRLLDVAALLSASRGIAQKHVALRQQQLDVFLRTSSLAKAARTQAERYTETAKAASILASRMNEDRPAWTYEASDEAQTSQKPAAQNEAPIPNPDTLRAKPSETTTEGIKQDHFYEASLQNSTTDAPAKGELHVKQAKSDSAPLPDGSVPPSSTKAGTPLHHHHHSDHDYRLSPMEARTLEYEHEKQIPSHVADGAEGHAGDKIVKDFDGSSFYHASKHTSPVLSSLPRAKLPKHVDDSQANDPHVATAGINADTYTAPPGSASIGSPSQQHHHREHDYKLSSTEARVLQAEHEKQIPSHVADGAEGHKGDNIVEDFDDTSFYHASKHTSPVLSSLPREKVPKHVSSEQGQDEHIQVRGINSDTYTAPPSGKEEVDPLEVVDDVPQGINTAIFNSPRVAKKLGGKTHIERPEDQGARESKPHPLAPKKSAPPPPAPAPVVEPPSKQAEEAAPTASPEAAEDVLASLEKLGVQPPAPTSNESIGVPISKAKYEMRESRVPSSRLGRIWNYGGLAAGMFGGAITESLRRATGSGGEGSFMLSAANMDRLVAKLSRMRGAALKMGQMMSFQDSKMLPPAIQEVLMRVQDCADYMPASQRNKVLTANLGPNWRELFGEFDEKPIAAASIGQVHSATLASTGERVAVKVQYPGVADSIDSDLNNLAILLTASKMLPKGLFLEKTIANARTELAWECDYVREKECGERFQQLLADEKEIFVVPRVIPEASGKTVITLEFMDGVGVTKVENLTQEQRDWIGTNILRLCLREITEFRFMQTDPNWTNFLFNAETNKLELLDFGASREYPEEFIAQYTQLLNAASKHDKEGVRDLSLKLGYLTGHESQAMVEAHTSSVLTLAEPFLASSPEVYDFKDQTITERVKGLIPLMLKERLAPPPEETYSLHRKLSGAFLLCARLGSRVRCRDLFTNSMKKAGYQ